MQDDVGVEGLDVAGRGDGEPGDHLHERGLACTVFTYESVDFSALDMHGDRINRACVVEDLGEPMCRDGVHGCPFSWDG